jgi:hypothetical protein
MIQVLSRVGPDGVLKLAVPLGPKDANMEVVVTIHSLSTEKNAATKPWLQFLDETYGSCAALSVERGPQGMYESRESFSRVPNLQIENWEAA